MKTILVIDVGTSALKATLFTQGGQLVAQSSASYGYDSPEPNAAEADPEHWWDAFAPALAGLKADLQTVAIIGFTGQMHSPVLLDANHKVIKPSLLWLDRRCAQETSELIEALQLPPYLLNSTYTLPKLVWLSRNRPELMMRAHTLLFPKDYVRFRLTGVACTDVTEGRGASLIEIDREAWAVDRLRYANLPASILPPLQNAQAIVGKPLPELAEQLGLNADAQVIVGVGDVAAILGGAPVQPGRVMATVGTSTMIYAVLPPELHEARDDADGIYPYDLCGFRLMGGVSSLTGGALDWAWRAFGSASGKPFGQAMSIVADVEPGAHGLVFLPYLTGERSPFWRDDLRGVFAGLNLNHTWAHMMRAVIEGVGLSQRLLLDRFAKLGLPSPQVALSGGAARHEIWGRIFADTSQRTIEIYQVSSAASNVIYALCAQVLEPRLPFADAMNRVFAPPDLIAPNPALAACYGRQYAQYQRYVRAMLTT